MRIHRFYIENFTGNENSELHIEDEALLHQWRDIFRMKVGDELAIFNAMEGEWLARIVSIDKKTGAKLELINRLRDAADAMPKTEMALYMAIIKNSNFDLVVEKATELGVSNIIPVTTERTVKTNLNFDRLNKLISEAAEQSGRIDRPDISEIMTLSDAIAHAKQSCAELFFGHIDENPSESTRPTASTALFIGPEGGWSEIEITQLQNEGVKPISLGQFVLRAETAAIVGISKLA